jgi:prepilin-type N-terminal cleavage/methylation domain-containing protein
VRGFLKSAWLKSKVVNLFNVAIIKMKKSCVRGFSLTELLLAAAILAFVLCGLLVLFVNCLFLNEANRNLSLAMTHTQYIMEKIQEEIRRADINITAIESAITGGSWDWDEAEIASNNLVSLPSETIDTNVFQSGDPLGITVRVDWKDRGRRDRYVEVQTLITDY